MGIESTDRLLRKKFLKIRHAFRDRMRESNMLYDDEQRAKQIARRLQEQNEYAFFSYTSTVC